MTTKPTMIVAGLAVALLLFGALVEQAAAIIGMPFTPLSCAGVARRTAFRVAAVDTTAMTAAAASTSAAEASAATQQPAPPALPPAPAAPAPAAVPSTVPAGTPPIGTTVASLPSGCEESTVNDIAYRKCGDVYYRPAFSGNNLVYVVVEKP